MEKGEEGTGRGCNKLEGVQLLMHARYHIIK
jgi:hypothetical protein